ncbi:MAG: serpin family protein [Deltaproteobacteria bacterium]|nr:serpin family protein [Deltaproteobacteria bacterium]
MKKLSLIIVISLFTFLGCETGDKTTENDFSVAKSNLSRNTTPDVTDEQLLDFAEGNTSFAIDMYNEFAARQTGNIFYSPYSISIALAMTWAGAANNTSDQMADTLYFDSPADEIHTNFNALDLALMSRGTGDPDEFRLAIANAIWGQTGYTFMQDFLDTLALNYGSGLFLLDFIMDYENSRITINNWVEEQTEHRIKDLLPEGSVTSDTRLVLTNAIYFKADWMTQFEPDWTNPGTFNLLDGSTASVDMMNGEFNLPYMETADYQAVELPYKGDDVSMVVILPTSGSFDTVEASLDSSLLTNIEDNLTVGDMMLSMPKFSYEFQAGLNEILVSLGMVDAFKAGVADFSGIDGTTNLVITDVVHKAFVAVDEEGTEAAAATGVVVGNRSVPAISFVANRPFIYYIRDKATGTILFMGRLMNP